MAATTCQTCGATLPLEAMTKPNCPYCNSVLKHHAQAVEHQVLINKMMQQQMGPGAPQVGYGFGAPMQGMNQFVQQQQAFAQQHTSRVFKYVIIITVVTMVIPLFIVGIVFAMTMFF